LEDYDAYKRYLDDFLSPKIVEFFKKSRQVTLIDTPTHTSPKPENQKIETFSVHSTPRPYTPLPTGVSTPLAYLYLGNRQYDPNEWKCFGGTGGLFWTF